MKISLIILFVLINITFSYSDLEQVHVIFRHGERTPDYKTYPNDIYANETFHPIGRGHLTLFGKQQEYKIGQILRKLYDRFLGRIYSSHILEARSTDYDRTQVSLQLVLAGLWPPTSFQKWHMDLNWQPIPYIFDSRETDTILKNVLIDQRINEKYNKILELEEVKNLIEPFQWVLDTVTEFSGERTTRPFDIFYVYFTLHMQEHLGLLLPEWALPIFPEPLRQLVLLDYQIRSYDKEILKMCVGGFLKKLTTDIREMMNGNPKTKKMYLYSGHEFNLAAILNGLSFFKKSPDIPSYGSYIIIELHKIDGKYGIKFFYDTYKNEAPEPIPIPNCNTFCPINEFFNIIDYIITE